MTAAAALRKAMEKVDEACRCLICTWISGDGTRIHRGPCDNCTPFHAAIRDLARAAAEWGLSLTREGRLALLRGYGDEIDEIKALGVILEGREDE